MNVAEVIALAQLQAEETYDDPTWIKYINLALDDLTPMIKVLKKYDGIAVTLSDLGTNKVAYIPAQLLLPVQEMLAMYYIPAGGSMRQLRRLPINDNISEGWKLSASDLQVQLPSTETSTSGLVRLDFYRKLQPVTSTADDIEHAHSSMAGVTITSVTPTGGAATTWKYRATALDTYGNESVVGAEVSTAAGAATLTTTAYNTIVITPVTGAIGYKIYRTTAGTSPSTTGLIGVIPAGSTTFVDTGVPIWSSTIPSDTVYPDELRLPNPYHQLLALYCLAKSQQKEEELNDKNDAYNEYMLGKRQMALDRIWEMEPQNRKLIKRARIASLIGSTTQ